MFFPYVQYVPYIDVFNIEKFRLKINQFGTDCALIDFYLFCNQTETLLVPNLSMNWERSEIALGPTGAKDLYCYMQCSTG